MPHDVVNALVINPTAEAELRTRIRAEFAEMPGLKITLAQACRLFNAERAQCAQCEHLLMAMAVNHELSWLGELFTRADCGCRSIGDESRRRAA
jgi:hypothetical protein